MAAAVMAAAVMAAAMAAVLRAKAARAKALQEVVLFGVGRCVEQMEARGDDGSPPSSDHGGAQRKEHTRREGRGVRLGLAPPLRERAIWTPRQKRRHL